jgi:predicted kinase
MKIETKQHTIYLFIGPTECGKSTFAKNILIPQLQYRDDEKNYISNVQYLSSDAIRQELLGHPYDKYASVMMEASGQAFDILFQKLRAVTTFPINADFVIVDTTGLAEDFRKKVIAIAQENHYRIEAIVFDYRNMKDYYASERSKKVIANHVNRLRRDVLPTIRRSDFDDIHRIREKNFAADEAVLGISDSESPPPTPIDRYPIEVVDREEYLSHLLPDDKYFVIIGDVHETLGPLQELIKAHGFDIIDGKIQRTAKSGNKHFVLIGDFIDKGKNTAATVEFLYENRDYFYFVKGNHENFVSKYLKGEITEVDPHLLENFFDSIPVLAADEELQSKFQTLVDSSRDFYRYIGKENSGFFLTHAPCHNIYIGKLDATSRRNQRRFATEFGEDIEPQLSFLEKEGSSAHPYHVFGHVATRDVIRIKNKIGIDTGAVSGNVLTSVALGGYKPFFKSVPAGSKGAPDLQLAFSPKKQNGIKLVELNESDQKRLDYILQNKINFISGTMSPADKNFKKKELESLAKGLDFFKENGVGEVVLQPKYMGSRCNLYLSRNISQCYATSRNGFKITHVDLTEVYAGLLEKFRPMMEKKHIDMILFDGELLPWTALGKGLIEKQFEVVGKALETELSFLQEFGFEEKFDELSDRLRESGFEEVQSKLSKKELVEKFGVADYNNFKDLRGIIETSISLETHEMAYQVYQDQLNLYAKESGLEYKPFSILKMIYENGEEEIPKMRASEMFSLINDDDFLVVDLQDSYETAEEFFREVTTERGMEGVVIKPEVPREGLVPFMKVRNPDYLTLVYGYDYYFPHKYEKLMKQKNIKKKLQTSLAEYRLGMEMLKTRLDEIGPDNESFKQTVANLLFEESQESEIDPRL